MPKQYLRIATAVLFAVAGPALAQDGGPTVPREPVAPPSHSVEQANARLLEVAAGRAAVEKEYAASEQVCYQKFFVNRCLDQAKEKRRIALAGWRAIEVEANHYKRQAAVDKRDAELAERLKKDAEEDARRTAAPQRAHAEHAATGPTAKPGPSAEQRQAEHDAKERRRQAQEALDAPKRAANVADFEKKQVESAHRRARVAERQAERAEKARKKAEAAAAKAAASAEAAKAAAAKEAK